MSYTLPSPEAKPPTLNPLNVPEGLRHLIPWAEKYGISDDIYRDEVVGSLDESEELELMDFSDNYWTMELNDWLAGPEADSTTPSDEYITFTCLTMAADMVRVRREKRARNKTASPDTEPQGGPVR
jgi:hypothetical protein